MERKLNICKNHPQQISTKLTLTPLLMCIYAPELIISGAISNVAHKELLGVSPALPLVVAQLNLKIICYWTFPSFSYSNNTLYRAIKRLKILG